MIIHITNLNKSCNRLNIKKISQLTETINREKYKLYAVQPVFHILYSQQEWDHRVFQNKSESRRN